MRHASFLAQTAALLGCLGLLACDGGPTKEPPASGAAPADNAAANKSGKGISGVAADAAANAGDKPADGGEKVKLVEGAPAGDDRYALQIEPPADAKAGEAGTAVVKVVPKEPWHMNLDYPTSLKITAPAGMTVTKADLKKGDATLDEAGCSFNVEFTPAAAGEHSVQGQFKFAVCKDEACAPVTEDVEFKVAVK